MDLTPQERTALAYVKNTNLGATVSHFIEDHEPIGGILWGRLRELGLVSYNAHGKIVVTPAGQSALNEE